ncbi:ChbG/HpnK family deacetylase [Paraburkholderia kirstenboschensis]|uniref:ChbG/HpnK family deacetylase n=1 Tax=Paraburkholderia kirstenboschensis TaxID=1245436 RepID=A0ABZ0E974_9BURK|nr:ChbG/HpnK family deacetylase [Paraburkholderia kirstenboschensis]WOD13795.1 ChbG/HpnK family deacetylase [Paraburkholderia kirstenboschensis]
MTNTYTVHRKPQRKLIHTADDFDLHSRVNEAVERAGRHGVLTAASLMVCAPAARCMAPMHRRWSQVKRAG